MTTTDDVELREVVRADPAVTFTNQAAPGMHAAIIRATKPHGAAR